MQSDTFHNTHTSPVFIEFLARKMTAADEEAGDFELSELEKKAQERRNRLKELREQRNRAQNTGNENGEGLLG